MFFRLLILYSTLILLACPAPAFAQSTATATPPSNPTPATCGLPPSGTIVATVTYNLDRNCSQQGTLEIKTAETGSVELTINGNGHTISNGTGANYGMNFLVVDDDGAGTVYNRDNTPSPNVKITIKNVTFDGNNHLFNRHIRLHEDGHFYRGGLGSWILTEGTLEMENVTFTQGNGIWLTAKGTASLKNVLFENSRVWNWGISSTVKGGLHVTSTGSVTLDNAVFRDVVRTLVVVEKGGRLTTKGCLSFVRAFTHKVHHSGLWSGFGTWSDSSKSCIGTIDSIGNGGQVEVDYSPTMLECGLPGDGIIEEDAVYNLEQDCDCVDTVTLATGVQVTINANDHRIVGCGSTFRIGGFAHLTINKAIISGIRMYTYGGALTLTNSKVTNTSPTPIVNNGYFYAHKTSFEENRGTSSRNGGVYQSTDNFRLGRALFRDNMFIDNSGGPAELTAIGPGTSITLCGDNMRDDPPPEEGAIEPTPVWRPLFMTLEGGVLLGCDGPNSGLNHPVPQPGTGGGCRPGQTHLPPNKMLGAIGFICHVEESPAAAIEIWEILPNSKGIFALSVSQSEIEGVVEGFVACSRNGRAAVRVGLTEPVRQLIAPSTLYQDPGIRGGRDILISLGPTSEGKVHHYVIDHVLDGDVLGTVDTIPSSAPCLGFDPARIVPAAPPAPTQIYAPAVSPQAPRADGSIVHVVGQGDTVWAIGVAYGVHPYDIIALNELPERGLFIRPGQELLIRPAA